MFFRVLMVRESVSSVSCDSGDSDEIHQRERKKEREKVCVFVFSNGPSILYASNVFVC